MTDRRLDDIPYKKKIVLKQNRAWVAVDRGSSKFPFPLYCEILSDKRGHRYIWFKNNTYYLPDEKNISRNVPCYC